MFIPGSKALFEKLTVAHLAKEFFAVCTNHKAAFTDSED
jgi:hypothetical protein